MSSANENKKSEAEEFSDDAQNESPEAQEIQVPKSTRNLIGFWLLGLCNNYGYVIMLSAAHDLLHSSFHGGGNQNSSVEHNETNSTEARCNSISTGAILLADILPTLLIKLIGPFIVITIHYRVLIVVILSCLSFILTSLSASNWMTFIGVICASFSSGLGEISFLSYSSFFDKNVVSTWSSGTGGAGVVGALSYAVLVHWLSTRNALLLMLIMPFTMCVTFWILIEHPTSTQLKFLNNLCRAERKPILQENVNLSPDVQQPSKSYSFQEKVTLVKPLLKYMIPLGLVYFAEYFINQGLMELLYFPNSLNLSQADLYRWYNVDYQVGVLISRSSVNIVQINKLWILPILQVINLILLLLEVRFAFIPSMWLILFIIFYEGLLGGGAYVNTFYKISSEVPPEHKEFSMGIASISDSIGIALAGAVSLKVHDALCKIIS